ncbi:MAG TPA: RNA polymerase sigma factor [Rubrobacter sp.]|nr:RNA polymerase sigma factor [Rubrobacter sp.]
MVTSDTQKPSAKPPAGTAAPFPGELDLVALRDDLKRAVAQTCPRWMSDRSEDIIQVALMRVVEIYRKREGNAEFSSFYLRKAAYSAVIDEIRRLRRRQEVPLEDESSETRFDPAADSPDPERMTVSRELGRAIRGCLETLVKPRKLAVTLNLQGHSVPEIGRLMGWSTKKAENLVYRGMADLRGCLDGKGVAR